MQNRWAADKGTTQFILSEKKDWINDQQPNLHWLSALETEDQVPRRKN